jgi:hypothetical protein
MSYQLTESSSTETPSGRARAPVAGGSARSVQLDALSRAALGGDLDARVDAALDVRGVVCHKKTSRRLSRRRRGAS